MTKYIAKNKTGHLLEFDLNTFECRAVPSDDLATRFDSATEASMALVLCGVVGDWHPISIYDEHVAERSQTLHRNMGDQNLSTSGVAADQNSAGGFKSQRLVIAGATPAVLNNLTDEEMAVIAENT